MTQLKDKYSKSINDMSEAEFREEQLEQIMLESIIQYLQNKNYVEEVNLDEEFERIKEEVEELLELF